MSAFLKSGRRSAGSAFGGTHARMQAAPYDPAQQARRSMIAKVHICKKELGLSEEDYRDMLEEHGGARSASDCTNEGLIRFLDWAKSRGFAAKPRNPASRRSADHPTALKARAMWISLHHLGVIDNASEAALEAFARRQLKCDAMQWADQGQMFKLIEALKAMAERAGWSQQTGQTHSAEGAIRVLKINLLKALCEKLKAAGRAEPTWTLPGIAHRLCGYTGFGSALQWPLGDLDRLAASFGKILRVNDGSEGPFNEE